MYIFCYSCRLLSALALIVLFTPGGVVLAAGSPPEPAPTHARTVVVHASEHTLTDAFSWYLEQAADGAAGAQYLTGLFYLTGSGTLRNAVAAEQWLRRAASQEFAAAQYQLGKLLEHRGGVAAEARRWHRAAASQGFAPAQNALGRIYLQGRGVPADPAAAAHWFEKAARSKLPSAQINLGLLYLHGHGQAQDPKRGIHWLRLAARQGSPRGQYHLALAYLSGKNTNRNTEEPIKWLKRSATQGYAPAQKALGDLYISGRGVSIDATAAAQWYRRAAAAGDAAAMVALAELYLVRPALVPETGTAAEAATALLRTAAGRGNADAANRLGMLYGTGNGVRQDKELAAMWFARAARNGHPDAQNALKRLLPDTRTIATWAANARTGATLSAPVLTSLRRGRKVLATGQDGPWVRVFLPRRAEWAWMHESVLSGG